MLRLLPAGQLKAWLGAYKKADDSVDLAPPHAAHHLASVRLHLNSLINHVINLR